MMRPNWKWLLWGAAVWLAASAGLLASIPVIFGSPRPIIRITWRDLSPVDRVELERRFHLADPIALGDDTWGYQPIDTSRQVLRALVQHPAVAGVDGINARAATIARSLPLSPRRGGWIDAAPRWMPRAVRLLAYSLAAVGTLLLAIAAMVSPLVAIHSPFQRALDVLQSDPVNAIRALPALIRAWILRGIPAVSAATAGLFRIVFGACLMGYLARERLDLTALQSYEVNAATGVYGSVVRWLSAHPAVAQSLDQWLVVSGSLFIAGLLTPISYACFVAGFLLWACILTLTTSAHATAPLALAMIGLLTARWADAWSVDALLRRVYRSPQTVVSAQRYGFAIWIPRLVLGIAFLAAAWSKMTGGGPDWVLNGTVKYYFVSDFEHALVSWGPQLTTFHWVAVVMSGAAVLVESILITAAFSRSAVYTLLLGVAALSLLAGFALFQGVLWWGWWILLIAFLPWQRLRLRWPWRSRVPQQAPMLGLTTLQFAVVVLLMIQQVVMSALHVEARPMFSAYDMYSATYASADEFEDAINLVYRVVIVDNNQSRDLPDCLLSDRDAELLPLAAAGGIAARAHLRDVLGPCLGEIQVGALALEGDRRVFDWQEHRFMWKRRIDVIGPVQADWVSN